MPSTFGSVHFSETSHEIAAFRHYLSQVLTAVAQAQYATPERGTERHHEARGAGEAGRFGRGPVQSKE